MMRDWQVPIFIQAQAEVARMEAMKALNKYREMRGDSQAYDEDAFLAVAENLENLARRADDL